MHRNPVWLTFLTIIVLLTGFFSYLAVRNVTKWALYHQKIEVRVIHWKLVRGKSGDPAVELSYILPGEEKGKILTARYKNKQFRNEWAANKFLDSVKNSSKWQVWVRPNFKGGGLLERQFPWKSVVYAILLLGITIYFFWLGIYVVKLQKNT